ncbi:MAG: apolipoprotein N-acyltransferase [Novosphingobium sp.]|nr:MAG: apolipoprotein N-acyltransferase [Novosphingobium sp.]
MPQLSRLTAPFLARPRWTALLLGALAACGFQPLALWPLTLLAFAGLIELTARARTAKDAALIGWFFGVAHFSLGNNWIATAFTYQANMPAWLGGIAVVLLSLYLAVYPLLAVLGAWLLARRSEAALLPGLAACWIVTEWLRAWIFTGFAWNPLSMVLLGSFDTPGLAGLARWTGTYGLSGLVVIFAGMIRTWPAMARYAGPERRLHVWAPAIAVALVVTLAMEMPRADLGQARGTLPFTLVQPDVRQEDLNDPRQWEDQFLKTASYTVPERRGARRLVLWPESGVPDYLRDGYPPHLYRETTYMADAGQARRRIGRVIGPGSLLLTGAIDLEFEDRRAVAARNVITAIDERGTIRGSYAKAHLVPYGEYLPMRWLLEPLGASRLVAGTLDFLPGPGARTLDFGPWGKAGMQLCYEIVFSGEVADRAHRPDYIFNPTNDGWFGTWGPPQHLAQARMRAIEEGLPVLRATTTGISAVIDADGIVRQHVPSYVARRLDGLVPPADAPTLFARLGNMLPLAWAVFLLVLSVIALKRARR